MGETATRILLGVVIAGAAVLVVGLILLIWLLANGVQGRQVQSDRPTPILSLSQGERIVTMARGPDDLVLLIENASGRQALRRIDLNSGAMLGEIVVSAP